LLRKYQVPDRRSLARRAEMEKAPGRGALQVTVSPFLGRVAERAELSAALAGHRLVTAVGPGGIGKTRLAISVAADVATQRRDGAWFVDLVRVTDPTAVIAAVAEALHVPEPLARRHDPWPVKGKYGACSARWVAQPARQGLGSDRRSE
jgi:hypothetical protein